jgi:hypothetical protein
MPHNSLGRFIRIAALLIMGVVGASPAHAQDASQPVTGRNATSVVVGEAGKRAGEIRRADNGDWVETDAAGQIVNRFDETKRDDTSVYLEDRTRGLTLQLDLKKRKVTATDAARRGRPLYDIQSAQASAVQQHLQAELIQRPSLRESGSLTNRHRLADTVAAVHVEPPAFCWNDSVARGPGIFPGRVADCPAGYSLNGNSCKRATDSIPAPSRAADCPAGYTNNGASCERAASTKVNPNSRLADCPDGFKNSGDACFRLSAAEPLGPNSMTCKAGELKLETRCLKACEAGFTQSGANCVRPASTLGADTMTCKAGFKKSANGQRCIAECSAGYTNTGDACVREGNTLGQEAMTCKAGETRSGGRCIPAGVCAKGEVQQGGLCFKACTPGLNGVGAECWPQPPKAWVSCGVGAAKDAQACAAVTLDPIASVRQLAVSVGLPGSSGIAPGAMQKKYKEMVDAYTKAKDLPELKQARDTWEKANAQGTAKPLDNMAAATSEEDMLRYAAQVAAIVDLSQAGKLDATKYPKCSVLFPAK